MHKSLVLYPEPADPDHFRDYYVNNHLPLVMDWPGVLAWRYSFDVTATNGGAPYFAVFEADFADAAALAAARSSPQGQRLAADVVNYATGGVVVIDYPVQEQHRLGQDGTLRDGFGRPLRPSSTIGGMPFPVAGSLSVKGEPMSWPDVIVVDACVQCDGRDGVPDNLGR